MAKKTILRVLAKQAEAEDADQVCCRIKYFCLFLYDLIKVNYFNCFPKFKLIDNFTGIHSKIASMLLYTKYSSVFDHFYAIVGFKKSFFSISVRLLFFKICIKNVY